MLEKEKHSKKIKKDLNMQEIKYPKEKKKNKKVRKMKKNIYILCLAFIFLMGIVKAEGFYNLEQDIEDSSSYNGSFFNNVTFAYDENWTSSAMVISGTSYIYINYSIPDNAARAISQYKMCTGYMANIELSCWNGSKWKQLDYLDDIWCVNSTAPTKETEISPDCLAKENLQLRLNVSYTGSPAEVFEEKVIWNLLNGTEINITPLTTLVLPVLRSNNTPDSEGIERTYLYCTWRIDNLGQEAIATNSILCPSPRQQFTFEDNQDYFMRIDYAKIKYNGTAWNLIETGNQQTTYNYLVNLPEPPQSLFDLIYNSILNTVKSILCSLFPFLSFC